MWNSGLASIWVRDFDETKNVVYFVVASPRHFKDCCHCVIKVLVYFQIGELAMISSKDAKEFLYKLFAERFIAMQVTYYESLVNTLSECPGHRQSEFTFLLLFEPFFLRLGDPTNIWLCTIQNILSVFSGTSTAQQNVDWKVIPGIKVNFLCFYPSRNATEDGFWMASADSKEFQQCSMWY